MNAAQPLVWNGDILPPVRVDDYPNPSRELKTVMMYTSAFVGVITLQATIMTNPTEDDWFDVHEELFLPVERGTNTVRNRIYNSQDRFVFMRVKIQHVMGIVDRILVI